MDSRQYDAMIEAAAAVGRAAAEPIPSLDAVRSGSPMDEALARVDAAVNARCAEQRAKVAAMAQEMEALILDGVEPSFMRPAPPDKEQD